MSARSNMEQFIGQLLDGALAGPEAISALAAQDIGRLTPEDLSGAVDAVMARAVSFPEFPDALDCCGTGGDGRSTYNISTAVAFVLAARGVTVAKHGNRAVTSRSGSADVLAALGVNTNLQPDACATLLREIGISFLYAPTFHPGFARVAPIRKAIAQRTIFNLLGPLCNPARVKRQLIGVFAPQYCALMTETAKLLGRTHIMSVCGDDGMDELSITGLTHMSELQKGSITFAAIRPQDIGITPQEGRTLIGGDANQNARALRDVLDGLESPYADAVILNAAAMLVIAGKAPDMFEGAALARSTLGRGDARKKLDELIQASNDYD